MILNKEQLSFQFSDVPAITQVVMVVFRLKNPKNVDGDPQTKKVSISRAEATLFGSSSTLVVDALTYCNTTDDELVVSLLIGGDIVFRCAVPSGEVLQFDGKKWALGISAAPANNFATTNNVSITVADGDKQDVATSSSGSVYTILPAAINNKTESVGPAYADMLMLYDSGSGELRKISLVTLLAKMVWFANKRFTFFTDFINGVSTVDGGGDVVATNSGTGAGTNNTATDSTSRVGLVRSTTGTTATGRTSVSSASNAVRLGGGVWVFDQDINIATLSNGTERYQLVIGFFDTQAAANQVDGVYFLFDEGGVSTGSAASGNWQTVCSSNTVRSFYKTSVAVANASWINLRIEINASASSVDFYINGVNVHTETQNIPSGSGRELGFGWLLIKSVGTTARTVDFDYLLADCLLTDGR